MLPINILCMENIYHEPMICFETIENKIVASIDEHREISRNVLNTYVHIDFKPKIALCYSVYSITEQYVKLIPFQITKPDMVEVWKKWFEEATWIVSYDISNTLIYQTSYELKIVWSTKDHKCYFCIRKENLLDIFGIMCRCQNDEIIKFSVKTIANNLLPVLSIKCMNEHNILIYRPLLLGNDFTFLKDIIKRDLVYYSEIYIDLLFYLFIEILGKEKKEQFKIFDATNKVITLNFSEIRAPVFLFEPIYFHNLKFFNQFNIKLRHCQRQVTYDKERLDFLYNIGPTMCLKFIRFNKTFHNKFKMQNTLYKQKNFCRDRFSYILATTTYLEVDFSSKTAINFENQSINVVIEIKKVKSIGYNFTLYISKAINKIPFSMDGKLLDSITNIKIETFGKPWDNHEELNIVTLRKEGICDLVRLEFTVSKNNTLNIPNIANNIIYDILEKKNGFFSIQVQTVDKTLIDCKVNLTSESMRVLSSNIIEEHIETLKTVDDIF